VCEFTQFSISSVLYLPVVHPQHFTMHSSRTKGKTIYSETREIINRVNRLYKQEAAEKNVIFPVSRADERTAYCCGLSAATVRH
jgi:hypothetical protein